VVLRELSEEQELFVLLGAEPLHHVESLHATDVALDLHHLLPSK
jgi:hypothetical protein